jgi:hypothetical protein
MCKNRITFASERAAKKNDGNDQNDFFQNSFPLNMLENILERLSKTIAET